MDRRSFCRIGGLGSLATTMVPPLSLATPPTVVPASLSTVATPALLRSTLLPMMAARGLSCALAPLTSVLELVKKSQSNCPYDVLVGLARAVNGIRASGTNEAFIRKYLGPDLKLKLLETVCSENLDTALQTGREIVNSIGEFKDIGQGVDVEALIKAGASKGSATMAKVRSVRWVANKADSAQVVQHSQLTSVRAVETGKYSPQLLEALAPLDSLQDAILEVQGAGRFLKGPSSDPAIKLANKLLAAVNQNRWLDLIDSPQLEYIRRFQSGASYSAQAAERKLSGESSEAFDRRLRFEAEQELRKIGLDPVRIEVAEASYGLEPKDRELVSQLLFTLRTVENYFLDSRRVGYFHVLLRKVLVRSVEALNTLNFNTCSSILKNKYSYANDLVQRYDQQGESEAYD